MPSHPAKRKRVARTIRKEIKKGTKTKKAVAIGLSVERQRAKKKGTKHKTSHKRK